jgi:hypothetical protein
MGNKSKKDEMGGACSTYGNINAKKCYSGNINGRDNFEELGVY